MITYKQRKELIKILIDDIADSVSGDAGYAYEFVKDVMINGYKSINEYSDDELLQWHYDAFEREFLEDEEDDA